MMQRRAIVHVPDVHPRALAHGLETLEHGDVSGVVSLRGTRLFLCLNRQLGGPSLVATASSEQLGNRAGNALAFDPFHIVIRSRCCKLNSAEIPLLLRNAEVEFR